MTSNTKPPRRVIVALPVLAAMIFHAIALQRWSLVVIAGITLLVTSARNISRTATLTGLIVACLLGLIAGVVFMAESVSPTSPLPPLVISTTTGALLALSVDLMMCGRISMAWVCSWLLVAFSGSAEPSAASNFSLVLFLVVSLIVAAYLAGVFEAGRQVVVSLVLFLMLVLGSTFAVSRLANRFEGAIQGAFAGLFFNGDLPGKTGVGNEILIAARSSITVSLNPLLELSEKPGRLRVNVMDRFEANRWFSSMELQSRQYSVADLPGHPVTARELEMVLLEKPGSKLPSPAGTFAVRGAEAHFEGGWVMRGTATSTTIEMTGDRRERLPQESASDPILVDVPDNLRNGLASFTKPLLRNATGNQAKAEILESFFQENFEYSLDTNLMGAEHPLIQLLRDRPPAYCVYFASAMALMLRTEGIPSRVVSGYLPAESNGITGRVTIRQRDSHAWVEAWLPSERRFVTYDPTPGRSREQVIGTDRPPGILSDTFGALGSWGRRAWLNLRTDPMRSLSSSMRSPVIWATLLGLLFLLSRRRWRAGTTQRTVVNRVGADARIVQTYERYLSSLRRAGVTPRPSDTDDELIDRLRESVGPERAQCARQFIARYRRSRYGGEPFDDDLVGLADLQGTRFA